MWPATRVDVYTSNVVNIFASQSLGLCVYVLYYRQLAEKVQLGSFFERYSHTDTHKPLDTHFYII